MLKQSIYEGTDLQEYLGDILKKHHVKKYMVVGGFVAASERMKDIWESIGIPYVLFRDFAPNPEYDSVVKGVNVFKQEQCDALVAIGGGSAIDVAKSIKAFSPMSTEENYLKQRLIGNDMVLTAIPTTAGTGSESTSFAVLYYNGEKQSVAHKSILPQYVALDGSFLECLPDYQKKSALLDALCQAIESKWSINSTAQSQVLADEAILLILSWWSEYLVGSRKSNDVVLRAANLAGQAINITQTTAAHAMSYKITSLFGIPHGYAVALCLPPVWRYIIGNMSLCSDVRGEKHLQKVLKDLARLFGVTTPLASVEKFQDILSQIGMTHAKKITIKELDMLAASVNPDRLKNNPVQLTNHVLTEMYCGIFTGQI